jgi:ubiquinone/menaquinone biosynthesis C-methylase UbiE
MNDLEIKQKVRKFYDQIGWERGFENNYQNTQFEDLRPVSHEYIHRCHLRVNRYLQPRGKYFLDAGSGPVQYDEYLTYSLGYQYRVCLDISYMALTEARKKLGDHGLYVLADVSQLPFKENVFEGEVSLHTLHHLLIEDQDRAYRELHRCLTPNASVVIVNGWKSSRLNKRLFRLIILMERLTKQRIKEITLKSQDWDAEASTVQHNRFPDRTFVAEINADHLKQTFKNEFPVEIYVWRSVSVRFLRAVIQPWNGGNLWLKLLYRLEERFPRYFGENGVYPLVVVKKLG